MVGRFHEPFTFLGIWDFSLFTEYIKNFRGQLLEVFSFKPKSNPSMTAVGVCMTIVIGIVQPHRSQETVRPSNRYWCSEPFDSYVWSELLGWQKRRPFDLFRMGGFFLRLGKVLQVDSVVIICGISWDLWF